MARFQDIGKSVVWALISAALSQASSVVERSSFGNGRRISHGGAGLTGWLVSGSDLCLTIQLSDRIILTPPYPGNKRGALWAEEIIHDPEWSAAFDFRANGEERSGGNLQVWSSANVDGLAFGHCDYQYRNLGRPSKLQIKQSTREFEVLIDGNTCFKTAKAFVPPGNVFGITAASAESPDSFEAFRFVATSQSSSEANRKKERNYEAQHRPPPAKDEKAPSGGNIDGQVKDLQNRLQTISSATTKLMEELHALSATNADRMKEIIRIIAHRDQVSSVDQRIQRIERMVETMQREIERKDYQHQFKQLQDLLHNSHSGLLDNLQESSHRILSSAPRMGFFIFLIIAVQLLLAAAYVLYKKRRSGMPKKFL
ncbi:uncharacterized protein GIQ15_02648 [Arthroderma uncinatum]|uniref:uncharacterized protein n=1 Tax=Arthroderma uncinatum TaxID=74035 RepID=UPI00144A5E8F|nr:uncharacterized protein GIQ15_02648 [Arthroderma uncinatum]KAF3483324.1 hypothetical protein GIQ15_02648 [Arthroderma uncinatum]